MGEPGEKVDVFVVLFGDEFAMPAIAVLHADDLASHTADGEQTGGCNRVVVASESSAFGAYKDSQGGGCEDEDQHDDRNGKQGRTGVIVFASHRGGFDLCDVPRGSMCCREVLKPRRDCCGESLSCQVLRHGKHGM